MTTSFDAKGRTRIAAFALVVVVAIGFGLSQPALAANNGNGNANGNLVANNQSVSVDENGSVAIVLTGSGPSGFAYVIGTQPTHGALTGIVPNVTYTPNTNYFGIDSFTFHTHKGGNDSTDATVSITVNEIVVVVPPLTCDAGFHVENDSCVADSNGGSGSSDTGSGSGDTNSTDTGSNGGTGTNSTDTGSSSGGNGTGSSDSGGGSTTNSTDTGSAGSGSGTGTNSTDTSGSGSGGSGSDTGTDTNSTNAGSDNQQQSSPRGSSNDEVYNAGLVIAHGLKAKLHGAPIPVDSEQHSMYYLSGFVIFSAMAGANNAGYTWNSLSDGQQAWIIFHFEELGRLGSN